MEKPEKKFDRTLLLQPIIAVFESTLAYCGLLLTADSVCSGFFIGVRAGINLLAVAVLMVPITWKWQCTFVRAYSLFVLLVLATQLSLLISGLVTITNLLQAQK
jgi:hypothetical protein